MDKRVTINVTEAGRKGGKARADKLSPEQRSRSAGKAARARWKKFYAENPEKKPKRKTA